MYKGRTRTQQISIQKHNPVCVASHARFPCSQSRLCKSSPLHLYTSRGRESATGKIVPGTRTSPPSFAAVRAQLPPPGTAETDYHKPTQLFSSTNTRREKTVTIVGVWYGAEWKNRFPAGCTCVRAIEIERDASEWRMHWPAHRQTYQAHLFWSQRDLSPSSPPPPECGRFDALPGGQSRAHGVH